MQNLSLTINYVVKNFIKMMGIYVFTYNTITTDGVLNCEKAECEDEECECDCGQGCEE